MSTPLLIQRCANGIMLQPMQGPDDKPTTAADVWVFTDGTDPAEMMAHIARATAPVTRQDLQDVKSILDGNLTPDTPEPPAPAPTPS